MSTRRLAAILAADMVGYARLMGMDEEGTLARFQALRREVIDPAVAKSGGRVVKTIGDGILAEFPSAVEAVRCALEVQEAMRVREETQAPKLRLQFRIGINVGDVIASDDDIHGDGVNVAARLESLAEAGSILVSATVQAAAAGRLDCTFEDLGERTLKNIVQPVRVYRVTPAASTERPALALPDKPSIAVLPFQNMSGDPEQEYFADGMVEDITAALSRFSGLFVIARNSAFTFKGRAVDVRQVGRELGVRYVLEGSVRRAGGRIRFTAQLVEAATGSHIWAERYEGAVDDLFGLQDQITEAVAGNLEPTVTQAEINRVRRKPPGSLDAYDEYLRGLALGETGSRQSQRATLDHCLRAIALDANFAPAYGLAVYMYIARKVQGWTEDAAKETGEALDLVERGLRADRSDATLLAIAGHCFAYFAGDLAKGITYVDEALALNPNLAEAYNRSGILRNHAGSPRSRSSTSIARFG
jgi:adenylate cyclase